MKKIHLKLNDKVIVIAGNEKGKIGKIQAILKKKMRVIIEGVNRGVKHLKPSKTQTNKESKGSLKEIELPIHLSNVMLYDDINQKGSRIGYKFISDKKVRFFKKTNENVDKI